MVTKKLVSFFLPLLWHALFANDTGLYSFSLLETMKPCIVVFSNHSYSIFASAQLVGV